jgi:RNA polymerase sigma-70 factor (ECF subfamily)
LAGIDLAALVGGDKAAWDGFVRTHARLILAAVRTLATSESEAEDLAQDVFVRLCKDEFRLLKTYDPSRASISTWLTIVARSTARDAMRRKRAPQVTLEDAPEAALAVDPVEPAQPLAVPEGLLSPRQKEVLQMLYDRDMDVAEVAETLGVDPQTVRSMHHKALVKLRAHFGPERG